MFRIKSKDREKGEMLENIRIAHREWQNKERFFEEITDPDLVDYAIFEMEASKLKYVYLLKKWKEWETGVVFQEELEEDYIKDISING